MDGHRWTAEFEGPDGEPTLEAYPDPLTKGDPWTIGLGCTGPEIKQGTVWTRDQCFAEFYNRYAVASAAASRDVGSSCWAQLNEPRRAVLTDMAFQMGSHGLAEFAHMLDAVRKGHWSLAASEILASGYAKQTPSRAQKNASIMLSGEW